MYTYIFIFYLLHLVSSGVPKSKVSSDALNRKVSGLKISGEIGVIKGLPDRIPPTVIVAELSNMMCKACSVIKDKTKQLECKKKHCLQQTSTFKLSYADKALLDRQINKYIIDNKGDPKQETTILPILSDALCKTCDTMKDANKRKECIQKFCVRTAAQIGLSPSLTKQGASIFPKYFPGEAVVAELTNILCQACSKFTDNKKKLECQTKFCLQKSIPTGMTKADKAKIDANVKKYLIARKIDINNPERVIPILADALCKVCSELPDPKKRKECVTKNCLRSSKLNVQNQTFQKPASHTDSLKSTHN